MQKKKRIIQDHCLHTDCAEWVGIWLPRRGFNLIKVYQKIAYVFINSNFPEGGWELYHAERLCPTPGLGLFLYWACVEGRRHSGAVKSTAAAVTDPECLLQGRHCVLCWKLLTPLVVTLHCDIGAFVISILQTRMVGLLNSLLIARR
jgi:hypothetical protein